MDYYLRTNPASQMHLLRIYFDCRKESSSCMVVVVDYLEKM